ncbi:MAG: cell division protein FtsQ/DivIB [Candidatus Velamenicoccus archaeovorus]
MDTSISSFGEGRSRPGGVRLALALLGTALLVALTAGALSRSSLFHVRRIAVTGASHLSPEEVVRLSGISTATNAIWADTGAAARRLEEEPWIARATVVRDLPFTIRIRVLERVPVAVVDARSGRLLIAGDGVTLGEAPRGTRLPVIVPPPRPALQGPPPSLSGPARALGVLAPRVRDAVRRVTLGADGTVRLWLSGGLPVDFGWTDHLVEKADALRAILAWARGQATTFREISLVAPDAPAAIVGG